MKNFNMFTSSRLVLGSTQPPLKWVPGFLSRGVNWQGCEADHSPPTSAEVKKMWTYTSTPSVLNWLGAGTNFIIQILPSMWLDDITACP
jgi:hypothetical protein